MYMIKSCLETRKKINEDVEIKEILTRISIQNIISEWNSQFPKASWCQMERWHQFTVYDAYRNFAGQALLITT